MGAFDDLIPGGNLAVSEGKPGIGTNEAKTREAQFQASPQLREVLRSLADAQSYNMRLPTGRFYAAKNDFWQYRPAIPAIRRNRAHGIQIKFLTIRVSLAYSRNLLSHLRRS